MSLLNSIEKYPANTPIIIGNEFSFSAKEIKNQMEKIDFSSIKSGDVVAIIGNFNPISIATLVKAIEHRCVVVPLTMDTREQHEYFFEQAEVDHIFENGKIISLNRVKPHHDLIKSLQSISHPGLILFSSGTTGKPKAILHDMQPFLSKYSKADKKMKTMAFLLFDHIGGINTFFYNLYAGGQIICPEQRDAETIFKTIQDHKVALLPVSPTFLRLAARSVDFDNLDLSSLKIITYGTEVMDQKTLDYFNKLLPGVDFRQTYGMSELGILSVKSKSTDSLYIKISGDGVETRIIDNVLKIRSKNRMLGYLNAPSPFDEDGWYDTKDLVEEDEEGYIRIKGRDSEIINIGGIKISPSEIEEIAGKADFVDEARAYSGQNPITGHHLELELVINKEINKQDIKAYLKKMLPETHQPSRIKIVDKINYNHRFKRTG